MKVNRDFRLPPKQLTPENIVKQNNIKFSDIVQNQSEKLQLGQIQAILTEIEKAGDRLAKSRNFNDLVKYKNLIKGFIKEIVDNGLQLKSSNSWNEFGQNRILKIVNQIDDKLIQMTDELLVDEADNIRILSLLGEIKGLLINLYS
ncbi:YaaR family protein [Bacillus kwashiorkori]|uniref:YaaR family protein n=1 Tax=Bacillus kwashiorkori TaxID=1522318 RepID=UPI00078645B7|nr:YaaR family protein [Bacillus kwashiorkori]